METIIVSDINIDYSDKQGYAKHRLSKGLCNMHFKQLVDFTTRPVSKSCLDHVYCNQPQRITLVTSHNIGLSDHLPVFVVRKYTRDLSARVKTGSRIRYRDMKHFDEKQFLQSLLQAPWDTAFLFDDIDDVIYAWEQIFNSVLDSLCPWREKRVKQATQPQWMTKAVIKQLHIRDHLLKVARRSDDMADWANYRSARNKAVAILRSAKREFYNNSFENNKNNARAIWKSIKTVMAQRGILQKLADSKLTDMTWTTLWKWLIILTPTFRRSPINYVTPYHILLQTCPN